MSITNEPGYYEEGKFGIRIENQMQVKELEGGKVGFECITYVPY